MIKAKLWDGGDLSGPWQITYKVDGVRAIIVDGVALSRSNKPLYNLELFSDGDYEIFLGDWERSVSSVRTIDGSPIDPKDGYRLDAIDPRLWIEETISPSAEHINTRLAQALEAGYEGLVLRNGERWLKVKPKETYDVLVLDIIEGKGKNEGKLGAFVTEMGNVGTGLSDLMRVALFTQHTIGQKIEVECMELTKDGKFRHPVFKRLRWDK